jgi:hypothetical protein
MDKSIINKERKREIKGSFGWIEHRFIREGYIKKLSKNEMLVYFFLALVSDRNGISFYSVDKATRYIKIEEFEYFQALSALEQKNYVQRKGSKTQLLSLPPLKNVENSGSFDFQRSGKVASLGDILKGAING